MAMNIDACVAQHQGDRKEQQDRVALLPHPKGGGVSRSPSFADGNGRSYRPVCWRRSR